MSFLWWRARLAASGSLQEALEVADRWLPEGAPDSLLRTLMDSAAAKEAREGDPADPDPAHPHGVVQGAPLSAADPGQHGGSVFETLTREDSQRSAGAVVRGRGAGAEQGGRGVVAGVAEGGPGAYHQRAVQTRSPPVATRTPSSSNASSQAPARPTSSLFLPSSLLAPSFALSGAPPASSGNSAGDRGARERGGEGQGLRSLALPIGMAWDTPSSAPNAAGHPMGASSLGSHPLGSSVAAAAAVRSPPGTAPLSSLTSNPESGGVGTSDELTAHDSWQLCLRIRDPSAAAQAALRFAPGAPKATVPVCSACSQVSPGIAPHPHFRGLFSCAFAQVTHRDGDWRHWLPDSAAHVVHTEPSSLSILAGS